MLTKRIWVYAVAVAAAMGACKPSGPQTTESGLTYEIFRSNDEGTKLDSGLIGLVYMKQYVIKGTDTINQRVIEEATPIGIGGNTDPIMEGLRMLHKGDSAKFSCDASKLFTGPQGVPPGVPADAQFHFYFGISDVFDQTQFEAYQAKKMEEAMAAMKVRIEKEEGKIKEYLAANNLTAQRSENGIYYVVTKEGKGKLPTAGDKLAVHYTGTLMADGKKFDSSVDRGQTFEFPVGMGRVIPGWDEGFLLLKEGSEAILLIPSDMAYGERGAGSDIPPGAILRFDVQFVKNNGSAIQPPQ